MKKHSEFYRSATIERVYRVNGAGFELRMMVFLGVMLRVDDLCDDLL